MQRRKCLVCFIALVSAQFCVGYVDPAFEAADLGCLDHPTGRHAPVDSKDINFIITTEGKPVTKVCPGQTYSVQLTTPQAGSALLTSTVGQLGACGDTCPGRAVFDSTVHGNCHGKPSDTWTAALEVPCTAQGSMELAATSSSTDDGFSHDTVTIPVDATCAAASCGRPSASTATTKPFFTSSTATMKSLLAATATAATFSATMCKQAVQAKPAACKASSLGYSCSTDLGGVTTHWSVGGCAPANPCTAAYTLRNPSASPAQSYLHYAATYATTGYVSVGFASTPGHMPGTDAVIGWVGSDGTPTVNSYHIPGTSVNANDLVADADQWMVLAGVSVSGGTTTVCFSRAVDATAAGAVKALPLTPSGIKMNWAVGRNGQRSLTQHVLASGYVFNPTTGVAAPAGGRDYSALHGGLMAVAWIILAPAGVLMARQKWVLGDRKLMNIHWWFQAHRAIQSIAIALFVAGLGLAFGKLNEPNGGVGQAHTLLAWLMIALAVLQVISIFIRPHPGTPKRTLWNLFHWNIGRLALASGIINVFIGLQVYRNKESNPVGGWFATAGVILGVWMLVEVALTLLWLRRSKAATKDGRDDVEVAVVHGQPSSAPPTV